MRYIRPKSLTWWSGVMLIVTGGSLVIVPESSALREFGMLLSLFAGSGNASPAFLIFSGLGLIGIRDKMERAMREKE